MALLPIDSAGDLVQKTNVEQIVSWLSDSCGRFENQATLIVYMALSLRHDYLSQSTLCEQQHSDGLAEPPDSEIV